MSAQIDAEMARRLHHLWRDAGDQIGWAITRGGWDHGELYIARPHVMVNVDGAPKAQAIHLQATSLEQIRRLLPPGLVRFDRSPGDDPVIVEAWM